jgi:hypothetical protein
MHNPRPTLPLIQTLADIGLRYRDPAAGSSAIQGWGPRLDTQIR